MTYRRYPYGHLIFPDWACFGNLDRPRNPEMLPKLCAFSPSSGFCQRFPQVRLLINRHLYAATHICYERAPWTYQITEFLS